MASALKQFDPRNGGFGSQPKFPHPATLDLLLEVAVNRDNQEARVAFETTLENMARGGVYDQLAGGFHRYSVDERWVVPHFEKMLYDNTELLRNFVHGFQSLGRQDFLATAKEIVSWLDRSMTDRARGGFYASQDADIDLDDDGDYFTWTLEEVAKRSIRPKPRTPIRYWTVREVGDMRHNQAKNVLHVRQTLKSWRSRVENPWTRFVSVWMRSRQSFFWRARNGRCPSSTARSIPAGTRWPYRLTWRWRGFCKWRRHGNSPCAP